MRTNLSPSPDGPPFSPLLACTPTALAALGPLLCLHVDGDPHLLSGWRRARSLIASVHLDSDGPCEALRFFDATGVCCWQLHLLPDSDFHAWERLLARLPTADAAPLPRADAWTWRRRPAPHWRACALRLHALDGGPSRLLAAADTRLSPLGHACAGRIARRASAVAARLAV
jgi:hypothetical protein